MKLNKISIENFKGLKEFQVTPEGQNATLAGPNGSGKTSVFDAFLWLLFGKDSTGRKDFELRPLDDENTPIKGLVTLVEAQIDLDGQIHTYRKENHENVVKGQLGGYTTLCWIDEVPKKISEYQEYINSIMPEETFKMLTDPHHFNEKLHWTDRRKVLLEIAGDIGTPEGFDTLLAQLNGRTLAEYKSVLAEQKKRITEERDEINPRIDELVRGMGELPKTKPDTSLAMERTSLNAQISRLDSDRQKLVDGEQARQKLIEQGNQKRAAQLRREAELASNTDGIQKQLDEKQTIQKGLAKLQADIDDIHASVAERERQLKNDKADMESHTRQLVMIREEFKLASTPTTGTDCPKCKQSLPAGHFLLAEDKKATDARLAGIKKRGDDINKLVNVRKKEIADSNAILKELSDAAEKLLIKKHEGLAWAKERMATIERQIATKETTPPQKDSIWLALDAEIDKLADAIGEPASKQMVAIENERYDLTEKLTKINTQLASADRIKQDTARIEELKEKEKTLAQQLADLDKTLQSIEDYRNAESRMIEEAVNGKFKYITFKLFNTLLNGSTEECCEAMLDGTPYADCSYGEKMRMGIDVINVMAEHYGKHCPLFIDNSESLTYKIEYAGQLIELRADSKTKKLTCKVAE